jgi:PAS domain S-box-containing protein
MAEKEKTPIDITQLFERHPYLKQIMQAIKVVIWVFDPVSGRIIYVSPAFETIWGYSFENIYSEPLTLIKSVHPEDRVKVIAASPDDNRKSLSQSYRILRPDGSLRWISAHTFTIFEEETHGTYQVVVAQDITEQNQVDQTLRKALDRSREQFTISRRMSLARKPEGVLKILMSAAEFRSAKRAFVLFFDYPKNRSSREIEIITSWGPVPYSGPPEPSDLINEANLLEDLSLLDFFHPSKPVMITEISQDQRLPPAIRKQLLERQIETMAIFPLTASGNWLGCLVVLFSQVKHFEPIEFRHLKVLVDQATITLYNLHLLEIEAESRHEAEHANEIKTEFLAMISHELRTPLTSIIGFTTTLLADDVDWEPSEQRDFIKTIQLEADRLQELIDHLLDLSRLEAGMLPIVLEPHYLHEVIEDALPQFKILTNGQKIILHLPANLPPVNVDPKRLAQVFVNLVRNASTYAPQGTEIGISAHLQGDFVQISVSDQGPGISPADRKKVFKAFLRGQNAENSPGKGAGLGLAICKGLIEAHGGRIWIKKKSSLGATICFTVPVVPSEKLADSQKGE